MDHNDVPFKLATSLIKYCFHELCLFNPSADEQDYLKKKNTMCTY